jgi:drug/metabolite transporter (DMT)-like permease
MYSNIVPLVAMAIAAAWLGEPMTASKIAGAVAVLAGVLLTRLER